MIHALARSTVVAMLVTVCAVWNTASASPTGCADGVDGSTGIDAIVVQSWDACRKQAAAHGQDTPIIKTIDCGPPLYDPPPEVPSDPCTQTQSACRLWPGQTAIPGHTIAMTLELMPDGTWLE